MDTSLKTEAFEFFSPVWRGSAIREVTEEIVVPDTMEDAGVILDAAGVLTMRGRETAQDAAGLSVSLSVCVLYSPENGGGGLRSLDVPMTVEIRLDAPGVDMDCRMSCCVRVRSLEARLLNSRKIRVRAELEADAACYRRECIHIAGGMETEGSVHLRSGSVRASVVSDVREKTFALTDEYSVPSSLGEAPRILTRRAEIVTDDVQYVGGKVLLRGRVRSELLMQDGETDRIAVGRYETEFSQLMEIDVVGEDAAPEIRLFLTGAYYDMPEQGGRGSIQAEFHMGAQCVCRERREIPYISDLYSNRAALVPARTDRSFVQASDPVVLRQTVAERIEGAEREAELLQSSAAPGALSQEDGAVRTSVNVQLLYRLPNGGYTVTRGRLSAEFTLPDASADAVSLRDAFVTVTDVYCVPGTGDVRVSLRLDARAERETVISFVSEVREDAEAWQDRGKAPSAVLLRVPEGADLWDVARRFHSSVEDILAVNEGRAAGLLLVPKGR